MLMYVFLMCIYSHGIHIVSENRLKKKERKLDSCFKALSGAVCVSNPLFFLLQDVLLQPMPLLVVEPWAHLHQCLHPRPL